MALPVHEKDHHNVIFDPNTDEMTILQNAERSRTKLMAYFEANWTDPHTHSLLYVEFPEHFVWKASSRTWSPCQCDFIIGHLHFAPPSSGERFYMRTHVKATWWMFYPRMTTC
jgi:hypothetical protein